MSTEVVIVGAGMGGLAAAVSLSARPGFDVTVVEAADHPGGKVGWHEHDNVVVDTGPSLFTLRDILANLLRERHRDLEDELTLCRDRPHFRYHFPGNINLDIGLSTEETTDNIRSQLGAPASDEFIGFLAYARRIWEAAAPYFVLREAPSVLTPLKFGLSGIRAFRNIDALNTMEQSIDQRINDPRLRDLFLRYATFNGSDPRCAPATLNCIAWVDLGLGGWGIKDGMRQLAMTLERIAKEGGVRFIYDAPVRSIDRGARRFQIDCANHRLLSDALIINADIDHLVNDLWDDDSQPELPSGNPRSMSAWNAVIRARRRPHNKRPAHTVIFPQRDYMEEFVDIFDQKIIPSVPTLYLCAQEKAHCVQGWKHDEPLFVMVNAPPLTDGGTPFSDTDWKSFERRVLRQLVDEELIDEDDDIIWRRTPSELGHQFPGSRGSLYGSASNDRFSAFKRAANRVPAIDGLYLASAGAHPGGGVPLCIQSGRQAARELLQDCGFHLSFDP